MVRSIIILTFIFLTIKVFPQTLNIEQFRVEKDTSGVFYSNLTLGYSNTRQLNTVQNFRGGFNTAYLAKKHGYMWLNNFNLLKVEGREVIKNGYTHLRFNLFRRKKFSPENFYQYQIDFGRGLQRRLLVGACLRTRLYYNKNTSFSFCTGVMLESEQWKLRNNEPVNNEYFKSTSNLSLRTKLIDNVSLVAVAYYQARPEHFFHPRVISDLQFLFTVNKTLSLSAQFSSFYDARPVINIPNYTHNISGNLIVKL